MKTAILSLSFLFAQSSFASMPQYPNPGMPGMPNVNVYYASWCEGNALVTDQSNNRSQRAYNCGQERKMCVQRDRRVSANQIIIYAACEYPSSSNTAPAQPNYRGY